MNEPSISHHPGKDHIAKAPPPYRIGDLRRDRGLNQKELGDKLGVGQTTVSAWETGKNEPDYRSIRAMAELFEVSADYLLGFDDDDLRRGLMPEEFEARQERLRQKLEKEQEQKDIQRYLREQELQERDMTEEELDEWKEDALRDEWKKSGLPVQFETYKVIRLMEEGSKAQRTAALEHVQITMKYLQA